MKIVLLVAATAMAVSLVGCSTTPVAVSAVGPNPEGIHEQTSNGQLEVYSALVGRSEGNNPGWFQHADYTIYTPSGATLRHVWNAVGNYSRRPKVVSLPPGKYLVKARAKDYFHVDVPVVIESGRLTKIHLDDGWQPNSADTAQVVTLPTGHPVGWNANSK